MGGIHSRSRLGGETRAQETAEYLIGEFIGEKSFPVTSDYWQKLLELPIDLQWSSSRVTEACRLFAKNNCKTRHLAKILIHLVWCLQECVSTSDVASSAYCKAINAMSISSIFLKYIIENSKSNDFGELCLTLIEAEPLPNNMSKDQDIANLVMHSMLNFIAKVDVSNGTYLLHYELLYFMLVSMSTQLVLGPSPVPSDIHPFIDSSMTQESSLVNAVVHKLLVMYMTRPRFPFNSSYNIFSGGKQRGVLKIIGSAAANLMLLPFNFLGSPNDEVSRNPLAEGSLKILLILAHYHRCPEYVKDKGDGCSADSLHKQEFIHFENPFRKALETVRDTEFDRIDIEGNAHSGPFVRLPFASLYDTLGMCVADETSVLLLYSLIHGNPDFLEYVLVRTDLDTLLMPMLETLYNAPRTSNHIYIVLCIFLMLSEDSSFNASIHKLILPNVPWYQERLIHQTSLGSLLVIILVRTVKYNLFTLKDIYLHSNCLATLSNMAPHVHRLSAYASQRLVSLVDMLSRKYNKLAEIKKDKMQMEDGDRGDILQEDSSLELSIFTDFLRLGLEIINAILTYALPCNPEVVYAIMHRQEIFLAFKNYPRLYEIVANIYAVLDFFNRQMDAQNMSGESSVEKVLQIIIDVCRSWRGEGVKVFSQLRFTYQQESDPEEFFIPYVWELVLSRSGFTFNPSNIKLFPVPLEAAIENEPEEFENGDTQEYAVEDENLV